VGPRFSGTRVRSHVSGGNRVLRMSLLRPFRAFVFHHVLFPQGVALG